MLCLSGSYIHFPSFIGARGELQVLCHMYDCISQLGGAFCFASTVALQSFLFDVVKRVLSLSPASRERVFMWLACVLASNARSGQQLGLFECVC